MKNPFQHDLRLILDVGLILDIGMNQKSDMLKQEFILIRIFNNYQQVEDKSICC